MASTSTHFDVFHGPPETHEDCVEYVSIIPTICFLTSCNQSNTTSPTVFYWTCRDDRLGPSPVHSVRPFLAIPDIFLGQCLQHSLLFVNSNSGGRSLWEVYVKRSRNRTDEVLETLTNKKVYCETCFLSDDGQGVYYFIEVKDMEKGGL